MEVAKLEENDLKKLKEYTKDSIMVYRLYSTKIKNSSESKHQFDSETKKTIDPLSKKLSKLQKHIAKTVRGLQSIRNSCPQDTDECARLRETRGRKSDKGDSRVGNTPSESMMPEMKFVQLEGKDFMEMENYTQDRIMVYRSYSTKVKNSSESGDKFDSETRESIDSLNEKLAKLQEQTSKIVGGLQSLRRFSSEDTCPPLRETKGRNDKDSGVWSATSQNLRPDSATEHSMHSLGDSNRCSWEEIASVASSSKTIVSPEHTSLDPNTLQNSENSSLGGASSNEASHRMNSGQLSHEAKPGTERPITFGNTEQVCKPECAISGLQISENDDSSQDSDEEC